MKILIVGCGKLGAGLAIELYKKGHTITIIDSDENAFYRLGSDFNGTTVVGNGYDKVTLEEDDLRKFKELLEQLDDCEDVQNVYHNVQL